MGKYRYKRTHSIKNKKYILYIIMLFFVMGIGYAALTSNLSIAGNTEIASNTWNIHFENASDSSTGSTEIVNHATISGTKNNIVTYGIKLKNSADTYQFTVDVVNSGSLPGKISLSTMSGLTTEAATYIDYTVTYSNGTPVQIGDILNANYKRVIVVKVFYKEGVSVPSDLNLSLYFNLEYVQSETDYNPLSPQLQQLIADNSSCISKYEGQVTDEVGNTVTASNVYFNKCSDKRNIIFGGYCWQMIRTTETGGIKMIYNGEPVNGKCESTRGTHKGIVQSSYNSQNIASSYLYGSSFTYDNSTSEFTLVDTTSATWSDSTYQNLLGKFTCKNTSGTCTTLYSVNGYHSATTAYTSYYTIGDTNYAQIGKSSFNSNDGSPAMVGYMFNKVYNYNIKSPGTNTYKYGSTFTYENGTYTLSGTTQDISDWSTGYNTINNTHYTCWNDTGTCTTISYIYNTISSQAYYFNISGGKGVSDILGEMLSNNDVNRYNSSIKGIIDSWYAQNLSSKTNMLEDTVYCNARNIASYGGWDPDGGNTDISYNLEFKSFNSQVSLDCPNETDQFAVSNYKAKLTYPIALLQHEEIKKINSSSLLSTGASWRGFSPSYLTGTSANICGVGSGGSNYCVNASEAYGVRPVVSLAPGTVISSGTGSRTDPFMIQE